MLQLSINGEARTFAGPLTVTALIDQLGFTGRRVALERNGEIVPRSQHAATELADGDVVEMVVAVGGG
ncbi:MAG TPA: sulfur carrier protein ThiS [Chitinolyticbacter sp.]|uniref:sulfur carrier protein ThiS n=1 Tax=Chitinolyticbacter albus TaxID=2961951 RepID=UPI002109D4FA|nr:sulfur carrier protein ThiS [Chitinolyticbacter albus]HSC81515.1 sulfur carrier protein ThiS [Chitinolyticbacter sp.]